MIYLEPRIKNGRGYRLYTLQKLKEYLLSDIRALMELTSTHISMLQGPDLDVVVAPGDLMKLYLPVDITKHDDTPAKLKLHWPLVWYYGEIDSIREPGVLLEPEKVQELDHYVWADTGATVPAHVARPKDLCLWLESEIIPEVIRRDMGYL